MAGLSSEGHDPSSGCTKDALGWVSRRTGPLSAGPLVRPRRSRPRPQTSVALGSRLARSHRTAQPSSSPTPCQPTRPPSLPPFLFVFHRPPPPLNPDSMTFAGSSSALGSAAASGGRSTHASAGTIAGVVVAILAVLFLCLFLVLRCCGWCYCCGERRRSCIGRGGGNGEELEKGGGGEEWA